MSHIATIKVEIKDLKALARAARRRGLELDINKKTYRHYAGQQSKCEAVLRVPGQLENAHEIGVIKSGNMTSPSYSLNWDSWNQNALVAKVGGRDASGLIDAYITEITKAHYEAEGFMVSETTNREGELILTATR